MAPLVIGDCKKIIMNLSNDYVLKLFQMSIFVECLALPRGRIADVIFQIKLQSYFKILIKLSVFSKTLMTIQWHKQIKCK